MTLERAGHRLMESATGVVELDRPLAGLTTYRLGGPASIYFEPAGEADLVVLGRALTTSDLDPRDISVLVLGRGSNVVVSDEGFPGVVIRMGPAFQSIEPIDGRPNSLRTGASTPLPMLANWAARRGLSGVEFAVGIPGSVGGAVRMNAGAHGQEMSDCLVSVRGFSLVDLALHDTAAGDLALGYRTSNLTDKDIVTSAELDLTPAEAPEIRPGWTSTEDTAPRPNPGLFRTRAARSENPPGDSAGRLVEAAGLKGYRVGGVRVSELHANFFVASEEATAQNVFDLVQDVKRMVKERFGVELQPEVRFVGPFVPTRADVEVGQMSTHESPPTLGSPAAGEPSSAQRNAGSSPSLSPPHAWPASFGSRSSRPCSTSVRSTSLGRSTSMPTKWRACPGFSARTYSRSRRIRSSRRSRRFPGSSRLASSGAFRERSGSLSRSDAP